MTETTIIAVNPRYGIHKAGSVGVPDADTKVKVVDPAPRTPVPFRGPGELVIKGP